MTAKQEFPYLGKDFSGIAAVGDTGRYLVLDDHCRIFEMSVQAGGIKHENTVLLTGLEDCEDIAVLPDGGKGRMVVVTEERRGNLVFFPLKAGAAHVRCPQDCRVFYLEAPRGFRRKNSGLEALAADSKGVLYAGKEESPKKIYRLDGEKASIPWDAEKVLPKKSDFAGFAFFEGYLIVLDQRGRTIRQVDPETGETVSSYKLPKFKKRGWRYEGIAVTRRAGGVEIALASEKNEVRILWSKKV